MCIIRIISKKRNLYIIKYKYELAILMFEYNALDVNPSNKEIHL